SSPMKNGSAIRSAGTSRAAPAIATAIARSKWPPFFGRPAGNRLTVIRASGQANPLLMTAERTRPRASLSAVSSRPIRWMPGTPRPTSASTSTTRPLIPTSATPRVRATGMSAHPPLVAEDELPGEPLQRHHVDPHPREPLGAAGQPPGREAVQPGHLLRGDGLQRRAVPVPGTGLHLDRDEGVAVPREDVDLALPASPVAFEDAHAGVADERGRDLLTASAERVTNGHGTTSGPNHRGTGGRPSRWNAILWMTEACGERRTTAAHAAAHGGTTRPAARPGGSRCEIETATPVRPQDRKSVV